MVMSKTRGTGEKRFVCLIPMGRNRCGVESTIPHCCLCGIHHDYDTSCKHAKEIMDEMMRKEKDEAH